MDSETIPKISEEVPILDFIILDMASFGIYETVWIYKRIYFMGYSKLLPRNNALKTIMMGWPLIGIWPGWLFFSGIRDEVEKEDIYWDIPPILVYLFWIFFRFSIIYLSMSDKPAPVSPLDFYSVFFVGMLPCLYAQSKLNFFYRKKNPTSQMWGLNWLERFLVFLGLTLFLFSGFMAINHYY